MWAWALGETWGLGIVWVVMGLAGDPGFEEWEVLGREGNEGGLNGLFSLGGCKDVMLRLGVVARDTRRSFGASTLRTSPMPRFLGLLRSASSGIFGYASNPRALILPLILFRATGSCFFGKRGRFKERPSPSAL